MAGAVVSLTPDLLRIAHKDCLALPSGGAHDFFMVQLATQRWWVLAWRIALHPVGIAVLYVAAVALTMFSALTFQRCLGL
jgi:hypothetical protein